jgi:prophage regulatory protein
MRMLRMKSILDKMGHKSHASIYTAIKAGLFTTGVAIGERSVGWPDYEADALIFARIAGQTDEQIKALVIRLHAKRTELVMA